MKMDHSKSLAQKANKTNYISTPKYENDLAQGVHDAQQAFGLEKYGIPLTEVPLEKYDWQLMALEESVDMNQYLTQELRKLHRAYQALEVTYNSTYSEYKRQLDETNRLKEELKKLQDYHNPHDPRGPVGPKGSIDEIDERKKSSKLEKENHELFMKTQTLGLLKADAEELLENKIEENTKLEKEVDYWKSYAMNKTRQSVLGSKEPLSHKQAMELKAHGYDFDSKI